MKDKHGLSYQQEVRIEVWNAITHGIAAIMSIIGLVLLYLKLDVELFSMRWYAYTIYGVSLILLFTNSTLYHCFSFTKSRYFFQKLDHASIYLLIAGTYTPYILLCLNSKIFDIMLIIIWCLALLGIIFETVWTNKFPKLSTFLYLFLGWMGILIVVPLFRSMSIYGIILLAIGGILYSIGTIFYRNKHSKWMHVIWHVFVAAAALSMYLSILFFT